MPGEGNLQETECDTVLQSALQSWDENLKAITSKLESHIKNNEEKLRKINGKLKEVTKQIKQKKKSHDEVGSPSRKNASVPKDTSKVFQRLPSDVRDLILTSPVIQKFRLSYDRLQNVQQKLCLLCFAIYPDNAVVKKRTLIYWWMGEGLIYSKQGKAAEEVGEDVFQELIKQGLIEKVGNDSSPVLNKCRMHPWMRYMLISLAQDAGFFGFGHQANPSHILQKFMLASCQMHLILSHRYPSKDDQYPPSESVSTIYNLHGQYLNLSPQRLSKCKKLKVLQLGRWQQSPDHHIEIQSRKFLKDIGEHKYLKFLSLRGISKITELPGSIVRLINLEILDLKACHNLEKLPEDISSLGKLTHLDVSECYLIECMPKGVEKLSSLQVLKGFVFGALWKKPCNIKDLCKLDKLRQLSISIATEAAIQYEDFRELRDLQYLQSLKISWGIVCSSDKQKSNMKDAMNSWKFPKGMKKLDLRGMPVEEMPKCLSPEDLGKLNKLYITGGNLASLKGHLPNKWEIKILRLKHLKDLKVGNVEEMRKMFLGLSYLESVNCGDENIVWNRYKETTIT